MNKSVYEKEKQIHLEKLRDQQDVLVRLQSENPEAKLIDDDIDSDVKVEGEDDEDYEEFVGL